MLKIFNIALVVGAAFAVKSGYEHEARTIAIYTWSLCISSLVFYGYPLICVNDEPFVVSRRLCIPPCCVTDFYKAVMIVIYNFTCNAGFICGTIIVKIYAVNSRFTCLTYLSPLCVHRARNPTLLYIHRHLAVRFKEFLAMPTKFPLFEEQTDENSGNLDVWFACYKSLLSELKINK